MKKPLTYKQALAAEKKMRRLENDPSVTKRELRLYMQSLMPCGHIVSNLLTCPDPPYGCIACMKIRRPVRAPRPAKPGMPGFKACLYCPVYNVCQRGTGTGMNDDNCNLTWKLLRAYFKRKEARS